MNKFILVAMNKENHTQKELESNRDAAYSDAYSAAYSDAYSAVYTAATAARAATTDVAWAAAARAGGAAAAEKWVNKYFERTGEDKQTYIDEIERINNMKTVMDAVNEFKGEWPYSHINKEPNPTGFTYEIFNALVFAMAANFGESSLKHLHIWQEGLKRQSEAQSVFTQAMADNGELPLVGMECMFADTGAEIKVLIKYISSWVIVFEQISEGYGKGVELAKPIDGVKHLFKPIDTRTDKEKAIDDMVEHLTNEGIVTYDNIMLKILVEKFIGGKITGVKWVGE